MSKSNMKVESSIKKPKKRKTQSLNNKSPIQQTKANIHSVTTKSSTFIQIPITEFEQLEEAKQKIKEIEQRKNFLEGYVTKEKEVEQHQRDTNQQIISFLSNWIQLQTSSQHSSNQPK